MYNCCPYSLAVNEKQDFDNKIKKYMILATPIVCTSFYLIYNKLNDYSNKAITTPNKLIFLYSKKLNEKITLRIVKYGDVNNGLLISNTESDPFAVKDEKGNNMVSAIVSPNNQACCDGALAGAIEINGGKEVQDDKKKWINEGINKNLGKDDYTGNPIAIKYGEAKLGRSGNFKKLKNIIHTVGPYVPTGNPSPEQKEQLKNAYINSCVIAADNGIQRIVFPPISLGSFGFPQKEGTEIAIEAIKNFSCGELGSLKYIDIWMINDGTNYPFVNSATEILGTSDY